MEKTRISRNRVCAQCIRCGAQWGWVTDGTPNSDDYLRWHRYHYSCQCSGVAYEDEDKVVVDALKEGVKYDTDKPKYDLLPALALHEVVKVYTFGAAKYSDRNWEKGMNFSRVFAATMRHLWAFWRGETHDPETGLHHCAHAAFGCLALVEYTLRGTGTDDRPYESQPQKQLGEIQGQRAEPTDGIQR